MKGLRAPCFVPGVLQKPLGLATTLLYAILVLTHISPQLIDGNRSPLVAAEHSYGPQIHRLHFPTAFSRPKLGLAHDKERRVEFITRVAVVCKCLIHTKGDNC